MRGRITVFGLFAGLAAAALAGLGFAAPNVPPIPAQRSEAAAIPVDVEVVLAVDVSYSMDPEEQALQREGYMAAVTSREFLQALRQGMHKLLVNAPPSGRDADVPAFPYASSRLAFHRLSSALAFEARGAPIHVWIACASRRRLVPVTPDPNAGSWADSCDAGGASDEDIETMARQVASLLDEQKAARRHAG